MSKICELTGTGVMFGNNVSHSERKTRCKYMPNLKKMALYSEVLGQKFRFRISKKKRFF